MAVPDRSSWLDYITAFFDDDGRAKAFVTANYINGFDKTVNTEENSELLYSTGLWHIMRCGNFNTRKGECVEDDIHPDFTSFIIRTALFHRALEGKVAKPTYDNAGKEILKIKDAIFNAWEHMKSDPLKSKAIQFYNTHVKLLEKVAGGSNWVALENPDKINSDLNNYRINLNKVKNEYGIFDKDKIMFAETLPFVPVGKNVIFQIGPSTYDKKVITNDNHKDFLRKLYYAVYKNDLTSIGLEGNVFLGDINHFPRQKGFDLVTEKLVARYLGKITPAIVESSMRATERKPFDEIIDMVSGLKFYRKENGRLYGKNSDGTEVDYDDPSTFEKSQCFVHSAHCKDLTVISCLLGNDIDLTGCVNVLKNKNIFDIAQSEVAKMHPKIALKLLEKFNIKIITKDSVNMPQPFDEWKKSGFLEFDSDLQKIMLQNPKLMEYLRNVILLLRENPAILNENYTISGPKLPAHLVGTKMGYTTNPIGKDSFVASSVVMRNYTPAPFLPVIPMLSTTSYSPMFTSFTGYTPISTGSYMFSPMSYGRPLFGGSNEVEDYMQKSELGKVSNAHNLKKMFNAILNELKNDNILLEEADLKGINNVLDELEKLEKKIILLVVLMTIYNNVHEVVQENEYAKVGVNIADMKDDIDNSFTLASEAKKIGSMINDKQNRYRQLCLQMGGSVYPALVDILTSKSTSAQISQKKYK